MSGPNPMQDRLLAAMVPGEPYTAGELARDLGEPRRTVDYHLRQLADRGDVRRKKHSEQRVTWWIES